MKTDFPFSITCIHINPKHPGVIYAQIRNGDGSLSVAADLDYCVKWIKEEIGVTKTDRSQYK